MQGQKAFLFYLGQLHRPPGKGACPAERVREAGGDGCQGAIGPCPGLDGRSGNVQSCACMGTRGSGEQGSVGSGEVRDVDVLALWFARRLSWIVCVFMFTIGLVALVGSIVAGPVDEVADRHEGVFVAIAICIWVGMVALVWAARGVTRQRRGSWTTMVVVLSGWMVVASFAINDPGLRPGVFIQYALTLPALALLLRAGTRRAYRAGTARGMPL